MGHIHLNTTLNETRKRRRGVSRADVSNLSEHIQLQL